MAKSETTHAERVSRQRAKDEASDPPVRLIEVGSTVLVHTASPINGELIHTGMVTKSLSNRRLEVEIGLKVGGYQKLVADDKATHEENPLHANPWWE